MTDKAKALLEEIRENKSQYPGALLAELVIALGDDYRRKEITSIVLSRKLVSEKREMILAIFSREGQGA